jgi:hypothetical protein
MAIPSTTNRNDYVGNGSASVYAYSYRILLESHLLVTVRDTAGAESTLLLTTDYTVDGVRNASGGNITLVNSAQSWLDASGDLKTDYTLTIRRVLPLTQLSDFRNQGDFFPETHEDEFDRGVMVAQQQQDEINRTIRLPETVPASVFDPALPATIIDNPGAALIVNAGGDGLSLGGTIASVDLARLFARDTFANLKATAAAAPTTPRRGYATDLQAFVEYTGDVTDGDGGWVAIAGAGSPPQGGGLI